ncbi:immune inhibitor A peptidase M6-domain-containing protein [Biscogniauxia marginata]|nr:immune inhibitor A peptidase M6-domain-containing protein [Biscogniauxia marginata]
MAHRCIEGQCAVSPHPDLLARQHAALRNVQGTAEEAAVREHINSLILGDRTGRIPGLNDGTIFPKSHFDENASISSMSRAALERAPLRGAVNVVLVLMDFQDVKMASGAKERFEELFFSEGKVSTGSVTEYYREVSNGKISLAGEVLGPFTLSHDKAYYANGNAGRSSPEPNSVTMAEEAVIAVTGKADFNKYDNDGNGMIDAFIVVHAGTGAEQSGDLNDIWSVKWTLNQPRQLNDVNAYGFLTIPEDAKIGVCSHEIGHLLFGWPDLYDTDGSSTGVGNWCLMSYGSWGGNGDRPVHPSAWCKATQGWIDVVNETENHQVTLADVKSGFKAHRLWRDGDAQSTEYFLVENRARAGFDESLPGAGLLVWHIDDAVDSNADENHPKVGLVQADGLDQLREGGYYGDAGDPFPGTVNNTTFNGTSNPSSKAYSGADTNVSITGIPAASASMALDVAVKAAGLPSDDNKSCFDLQAWYQLGNMLVGSCARPRRTLGRRFG